MQEINKNNLVDWVNPPTITDLEMDLTNATPAHDAQLSKIKEWLDYRNITGKVKRKKVDGKSGIVPKLIRKQAEWRYAGLTEPFLSSDDLFSVAPVSYEDKKGAIQNGIVLNNQINTKLNKTKFIDKYIRATSDEGTSILRTSWKHRVKNVKVQEPIYTFTATTDPAIVEHYENLINTVKENPAKAAEIDQGTKQALKMYKENGVISVPVQIGTEEVTKEVTIANHAYVEVCDFANVIIDPNAKGNVSDANFIIYKLKTSLSSLKKDGKYKNLDKIKKSSTNILSQSDETAQSDDESFTFMDKPRQKIDAYEYWGYWDIHKTGKVVSIVATWVGGTFIRMEENPMPDNELPFVIVHHLPVRNSNYGESDTELLKDNQDIIAATTRGMIDLMARSANGQMGMASNLLDTVNRRRFERGLDYTYLPNADPRQAIYEHKFPEIPRSALDMIALQNNEAEALTGVKAFNSGISGNALGDSATGIKSAMDATAKRDLSILRRLADGILEVGRKMVAMNAEFLSEEEVIRVTNTEFVKVRKDDLQGDYDLTLHISTPEADNDKAEQLAFMLQTMGQTLDIGMTKIVLADIARLRKMPQLAHQFEAFEPKPDPIEEERKTLEIELLKAQIQNELAKANENNANAALDNSKARMQESVADKTDLDYLETESGVTQERSLEKQDRQHVNNMEVKNMEGLIQMNNTAQEQQLNDTGAPNGKS